MLHLVICAAPPVRRIRELVVLIQREDWAVCVIPSPTAAKWIDISSLERQTGYPVRFEARRTDQQTVLPDADALVVAPATFNTINKWANGISDTFALGVLNEALGFNIPAVVSPYVNPSLAAHPAFSRSLEVLRACGVVLTPTAAIQTASDDEPFRWNAVIDAMQGHIANVEAR